MVAEGEEPMGERDLATGQGHEPPVQRKRYEKPALQTLGTLTGLTQNVSNHSPTGDNGAGSHSKTR